ncbi:MAG: putative NRPS-like protein biosynthetic cluster [Piccolia ochrophora]|nr:MAG: putative NRPS-like protein biosynthetic cluster [Piccolia ochrophora]
MSSTAESNMPSLPDPTADLHWSEFRGAIHDIFSENARHHPDRLCVVETASPASSWPHRQFTYRQINEASNILAHHLVQANVQRGEVVMIYAHRGVDLVLSVMGVLKSGATFSVIDPAYPPDRQNIYLDVARPRALIVIEKATQESGNLSETVRTFITEQLQIRTEVPALELERNGNLLGGMVDGQDCLTYQVPLRETSPNVVVGPDSTPTLSFTSGSEGRPKGVRGRHFSLAYYFPWMAETFNLSRNDKFTMLSGIAHDPIQRDIFTPLFLGAQLLVPSKEDIQNERLAKWMREHGATVTHLTPAMGQILVGGATAEFPALHHAFFVGDVLIKRDCRLLRNLAPNVNIVNMYGTTETQRAVSYFEVPCRSKEPAYLDHMGDVIPAGKGMLNVQLLVVDRTDRSRLCAVGETGEIYVRAAGLAEGYLGNPELTEAKFVKNWFLDYDSWAKEEQKKLGGQTLEPWREFFHGPRDRLYRTGDLGRYTQSGNVECTGRADNQVKIRGFRIELGEIDTYLSQHALVRENVTLVRRDKDEEPTLVSYIVPETGRWTRWLKERGLKEDSSDEGMVGMLRRFRALRQDVRDHLRSKLPAYAVPTVLVPLRKMPLNPNGKVDKPALPFPDSAQLAAALPRRSSDASLVFSETEEALSNIWGDLIPHTNAKMISPDDSFFDLGGHSILAQQMFFAVRRNWSDINVSMSVIFRSPTLRGFAAEIDALRRRERLREKNGGEPSDLHAEPEHEGYGEDAEKLVLELPQNFPRVPPRIQHESSKPLTVFLTGASGFLGAYILRDLLRRSSTQLRVIALVRAEDSKAALDRVRRTCLAYGVWSPAWPERLSFVSGDLAKPNLGLDADSLRLLTEEVDVVIHNGAWVHWVYPYSHLRPSNVEGTLESLKLCAIGQPKHFVFISSTSVLDTEHFADLSDRVTKAGGNGVPEDDELGGSRRGLGTGYGQSKWVAEYLVRAAGIRGLSGAIVRPGYVTGDSQSGVTNTDDFLIRMLKGCVQLSSRPDIRNSVNMVPVDHVARVVTATALQRPISPLRVVQVTGHPRLKFNEFLSTLEECGYNVPQVDYASWRHSLEEYVGGAGERLRDVHALYESPCPGPPWLASTLADLKGRMPLYHFVTNDLPSNTRAAELDDANAVALLHADIESSPSLPTTKPGVSKDLVSAYLAYLIALGFLQAPPPSKSATTLPTIKLTNEQREALGNVGGRGNLV